VQQPDRGAARPGYIVGIGASAGGLEAFETFFTHMPPDSGMAFVLVQHLDPQHTQPAARIARAAHPHAGTRDRGSHARRPRSCISHSA
jgi:two-component system CheB/CheR fusion protein